MTINSPDDFVKGLWDWKILDGCFGETKIKPTDCEGFIERKARCLWLETKRPGAQIPQGQRHMFVNLARTGIFTAIVVWGETNCPERAKLFTRHGESEIMPCDLSGFRRLVKRWFDFADHEALW